MKNVFTFDVDNSQGQVVRLWDWDADGVPFVLTTAYVKMWNNNHCVPRSEQTNYPDESTEDSQEWALRVVALWKQEDAEVFYTEMQEEIRDLRKGVIDEERSN